MRKQLAKERFLNPILNGLKNLFLLSNDCGYINIDSMEEFNIKFKPLGSKVVQSVKSKHKYLEFDYIYQNVVYTLKLNVSKIKDINFEVQPIENIIIILGGYEKIKEYTEFMINEEVRKIKI